MAKQWITCGDCGHYYETPRTNTKYCGVCRLGKDLTFMGDRTKQCWLCQKDFAPLERNESMCGDCCYHVKGHGEAECAFCHETAPRVRREVAVCNRCARAPEHRRKFMLSVRDKIRSRTATPPTEPRPTGHQVAA